MKINKILENVYFAFQPILNAQSGNTIAVEALLRGVENLNFKDIFSFLNEANREEILYEIEIELFKKALKAYKKIDFYNKALLFFNITNESANTVDVNFNDILKILENTNIPIDNICFDIDCSRFKGFNKALKKFINLSREFGFKTSVDNLGIDSSNLALLNSDPPFFIKVDKILIESLNNNIKHRTYIEYFIKMAHLFGINVIAECVETKEEYLTVKQMGFDMFQGYFACRPVSNIDGLVLNYSHIQNLAMSDKRENSSDESLVRMYMKILDPLYINALMEDVFTEFKDHTEESLFPVIDNSGHPLGLICEKTLKEYIYSPYGKDLLINRSINTSLRKFLTPAPKVDIKKPIEEIIEIYSQHKNADGIIITNDFKYSGFLYPKDIIKIINLKEVEIAREVNPLTKLPGNTQINKYIATALRDENNYKYFIYYDFDNFKPFNDTYGFRLGDRAILLFKDILFKNLDTNKFFIGHIGGDDFFVGLTNKIECSKEVYENAKYIVTKFTEDVLPFFDEESRKNGFYTGMNRRGEKENFPFLSVSVAIIEVPLQATNINEDTISRILAILKKQAKNSPEKISITSVSK